MRKILPEHRTLLYVALFLHDIAKGRIEDHSIAGARIARRFCPRLGLSPADTETVAWLVEHHLVMSTVAQSRDLSDRKTIENFAAVVQSLERMKLLTILTTADIRAVGPGVWNGWKAQLLRTLYYETEPVLTGGFSEVNRAQRVAWRRPNCGRELKDWPPERIDAYIARHYPAYWLKVDLPHRVTHARFVRAAEEPARRSRPRSHFDADARRDRTDGARARSSVAAVDARRRLRRDRRQHRRRADLHDHRRPRARHDRGVARVRAGRGRGAPRRAHRRHHREGAAAASCKLPEVVARRSPREGRLKAFAVEPEVTINNQWSNRYTVIEVTGLDRPGLLYELTATLSKLSLNIASAHVATFGERVVDVFYVTDLLGAQDRLADPRDGDQARAAAVVRAGVAPTQGAAPVGRGSGERSTISPTRRSSETEIEPVRQSTDVDSVLR